MEDNLLSSNSSTRDDAYFSSSYWRIFTWSVFFALMVITSLLGNVVVIWIVRTDKRMRTVTNYFLVNLAVSDILASTLNTVFSFISMVTENWPFGEAMCIVTQYIAVLSLACSSFTLVVISVERYLAIVHPLRRRLSKFTTLICISIVWLMSVLIALPHAIYASVDEASNDQLNSSRYVCHLDWPDGPTFQSLQEFIYNILLTLATYLIPMVIVTSLYIKIGRELWGSQVIGESTAQQCEIRLLKRKVVKMLVIVWAIFSICWLPYHIYFLVSWLYPPINRWEHIQNVYLATYWLAMSSSMYNPFIYCWMNSRFRLGFKAGFCCITR